MKKTVLIIAAFFLIHLHTNKVYAQWSYKLIQSDFDGAFKKAYTDIIEDKYFMIMESGDTSKERTSNFIPPGLALFGGYWCDSDQLSVDIVFKQGNENNTVKQNVPCFVSDNNKYIIFHYEIWTDDFIRLFSNCTEMKIRVNQKICDTIYITMNMKNSAEALNFMSNKNTK
jgi:hypothetical protein